MFAAPKLWNNLPRDIRESSFINSFKSKLKTFLFKKAFITDKGFMVVYSLITF